jgi:hypothetical protein
MCCTRPGKWLLCICVLGVSILSLSTILILDIGIVPTVWYFCCFPFIVFIYVTWYTIAISYDASVVQVEQELLILLSTWGNPVLAGVCIAPSLFCYVQYPLVSSNFHVWLYSKRKYNYRAIVQLDMSLFYRTAVIQYNQER